MTEENKSYGVTDTTAGEIAEVSKTLIGGMTPADKGWILGFIVVVAIIVGSDAFVSIRSLGESREANARLTEYLIEVEANRAEALQRQAQSFSDQVRRSQEVIRDLAHAVARDSERAGMAALSAIDRQSDADLIESTRGEVVDVEP